jgi:putative transposase
MLSRRSYRLKGFTYVGRYRYFVTYMTFRRTRHFVLAAKVELTRSQFLRASQASSIDVVAYCFMPDHVHLLLEGTSDSADCRQFISRSKQYSGFAFKSAYGLPLWQRDCYESIVNGELEMRAVAKYIVANPVRARLARHPRDYAFTGSMVWKREQIDELLDAAGRECSREMETGGA